jgi:hypothetical protein
VVTAGRGHREHGLHLLGHADRRLRAPLGLAGARMLSLAVADSVFVYLAQNETYTSGNLIDPGWFAGFLLLGLAGLWATAEPLPAEAPATAAERVAPFQVALRTYRSASPCTQPRSRARAGA